MNVGIFGAGVVGTAILYDSILDKSISKIYVIDINEEKLKNLKKQFPSDKCEYIKADFQSNKIDVENLDLVYGALPGFLGYKFMKWCISKGFNLVDVSFMPENPMTLDTMAKDAGIAVVPDAGVAPGLSNLIVGHLYFNIFAELHKVMIYVGALPEKPVPPLMHTITWSVPDFIEEYVRPARAIRDGKVVFVDPLSEIIDYRIENIGEFEAFYSDGLRTLLGTIKVPNMAELTLRYKGHLAIMQTLDNVGLLSEEILDLGECKISPKEFLSKIFERYKDPSTPDKLILSVEASGKVNEEEKREKIIMIAGFYTCKRLSAISTTTGFTASAIGKLILENRIKEQGIIPPELIAKTKNNFEFVVNHLKTFDNIRFVGV